MSESKVKRLDSWKEIATYLQRDERTALRWAKLGLPVYKSPGGIRGRVFAFAHEIDAWMAEHSTQIQNGQEPEGNIQVSARGADRKPAGQFWRRTSVWVCLLFVSATIFGAIWSWSLPRDAASYKVSGEILQVLDRDGRELWRHQFGFALDEQHYPDRTGALPLRQVAAFVDLDRDGKRELIFAAIPNTRTGSTKSSLFCFDSKGKVLWTYTPERTVRFGNADFAPPFLVNFFRVSGAWEKGGAIIWAVSQHVPWFPTVVAKLNADGKVLGEFWHAGHVTVMEEADFGGHHLLLVGATNNESFSASLSVISFENPAGSSPAMRDKYRCANCPGGQPIQYIVFPRTKLSQILDSRPEVRQLFIRNGGALQVTVQSGETPNGVAFGESYEFDEDLNLKSAEITENYAIAYAELRARGLAKTPLDRSQESNDLKTVKYLSARGTAADHVREHPLKK